MEILEPSHPPPGIARCDDILGRVATHQTKYFEAESLFNKSLGLLDEALPLDHPDRVRVQGHLAELYRKMGRNDEAGKLEAEASAIRRRKASGGASAVKNGSGSGAWRLDGTRLRLRPARRASEGPSAGPPARSARPRSARRENDGPASHIGPGCVSVGLTDRTDRPSLARRAGIEPARQGAQCIRYPL